MKNKMCDSLLKKMLKNTRDNSSLVDETERKNTSGQADSNPTTNDNNSVNVLLGASNCKRLGKVSPNCINASISGATLENIDETIKLAKSKVFDKTVDKVVILFGPFPFLGRIIHIPTTEFGKLHFTWCIACVRLILTWS
jgi:hypothetical protein